jgi:Ca2+/Na+ antiporter
MVDTPWQELVVPSTTGQRRRRRRQQQRQRTRELLTQSALTNNITNTTKVAILMNLPCSEIFQNVLRSNNNNTATSTKGVAHNNWNMYNEFDDYDARLCDYAKHCIGETPFPELLPLLMCRGVDSHDIGQEHNNGNNNKKITYESVLEYILVCILLPPALVIYLILLFRLLATTADSYFSPALESFSFEMGLPPRFAGATLLALGNGSPDLGSTINSILLWNEVIAKKHAEKIIHDETALNQQAHDELFGQEYENDIYREEGWTMSLGSLAGGGMFVGTIVCGLLIRSCDGITCRFSFIRDVSMYALSVCVVWHTLESGSVNVEDVMLYFGMYLTYITVILVSDLYQRNATMKKMKEEKKLRRKTFIEKAKRLSKRLSVSQSQRSTGGSSTHISNDDIKNETTPLMMQNVNGYGGGGEGALKRESLGTGESTSSTITSVGEVGDTRTSLVERLTMLMSNYDPASVRRFSSLSNEDDDDDDEVSRDDEASKEWQNVTTLLH